MIEFKNITKIYKSSIHALVDVSFKIEDGEFISIVGPSGEGKSTILRLISGLENPTYGEIVRPQKSGMVFQTFALFPWLSVFENVAIGLRAKNFKEKDVHSISMKYIEMMKLKDFISHRPPDLSGGQKQRVGIARALAIDPEVLLLDEPFSALDPKITAELHDEILTIWKETRKTIVMVSHSIEEAVSMADKVMLIKNYRLDHSFPITLPYPRREQGVEFMHDVGRIRKEFFR